MVYIHYPGVSLFHSSSLFLKCILFSQQALCSVAWRTRAPAVSSPLAPKLGCPDWSSGKRMQGAVQMLLVFDKARLRQVEETLDKDLNDIYAELPTYREKQKVWRGMQLPCRENKTFSLLI